MSVLPLHRFENIREAMDYAEAGGLALHVWQPPRRDGESTWPGERVPRCFRRSRRWAHLFCRNETRLVDFALSVGVKRLRVGKRGERGQHVDLCGRPLERAVELAEKTVVL